MATFREHEAPAAVVDVQAHSVVPERGFTKRPHGVQARQPGHESSREGLARRRRNPRVGAARIARRPHVAPDGHRTPRSQPHRLCARPFPASRPAPPASAPTSHARLVGPIPAREAPSAIASSRPQRPCLRVQGSMDTRFSSRVHRVVRVWRFRPLPPPLRLPAMGCQRAPRTAATIAGAAGRTQPRPPGRLSASPGRLSASPGALSASPGALSASPGALSASPGALSVSPGRLSVSRDRCSRRLARCSRRWKSPLGSRNSCSGRQNGCSERQTPCSERRNGCSERRPLCSGRRPPVLWTAAPRALNGPPARLPTAPRAARNGARCRARGSSLPPREKPAKDRRRHGRHPRTTQPRVRRSMP